MCDLMTFKRSRKIVALILNNRLCGQISITGYKPFAEICIIGCDMGHSNLTQSIGIHIETVTPNKRKSFLNVFKIVTFEPEKMIYGIFKIRKSLNFKKLSPSEM